jgi:hypothetical protein
MPLLILLNSSSFYVTVLEELIYRTDTTLDTVWGIKPGQFRAQY